MFVRFVYGSKHNQFLDPKKERHYREGNTREISLVVIPIENGYECYELIYLFSDLGSKSIEYWVKGVAPTKFLCFPTSYFSIFKPKPVIKVIDNQ